MIPEIPEDVLNWLRGIFRECNGHVSDRLQAMPTIHEPTLDIAFIEYLSRFQSSYKFPSDWIVTITAEYEGGARHYRRWEVADIGLIFIFRRPAAEPIRKLALLQSKRLYPREIKEASADGSEFRATWSALREKSRLQEIAEPRTFRISEDSRYNALLIGDDQFRAIAAHEADTTVPVYYQFYNPTRLPAVVTIPMSPDARPSEESHEPPVGVRVVPYRTVAAVFTGEDEGFRPSYSELVERLPAPFTNAEMTAGWPLETFIVDEALRCREGYLEKGPGDYNVARVVSLRGAPISAAIAIAFDLPE